jgi:signal transduction histidine kinase
MLEQLLLVVLFLCMVTFTVLGFGLYLLPGTVLAVRKLAVQSRRLAGSWCDTPVPSFYLPRPAETSRADLWRRRYPWLLGDPSTWRDLLWLVVNPLVGGFMTLAPAALILWGLFGVVMPAIWRPLVNAHANNWYAFIHVTDGLTAWLSVPLGLVFLAAGVWSAPALLRWHGRFTRFLLTPSHTDELHARIRHLEEGRSEVVDARAAELRQIERDLHDGAQARLVAMGMTLAAAERALQRDPKAARALLIGAQEASVKVREELQDLIRGIHPPILASGGLAEALRALAADYPIRVEVVNELPGRPDASVESAVYFTVSELLTNVMKHAHAENVSVDLRYRAGLLQADVTDDGRGGADAARGTGLNGIKRRLKAFDGTLTVSSPPCGPTMATMELPCVLSLPKTSSS